MEKYATAFHRAFLIAGIFLGAAPAQEPPKEEFKPSGRVWGYTFGDYFFKASGDKASWGDGQYARAAENGNAFAVRRVNLAYDYEISPDFSTQILLEGREDFLFPTGEKGLFVKYLYVRWKEALPLTTFALGQVQTPTWGTQSEKAWGYRNVEKTPLDFHKLGGPSDFGLAVDGKCNASGSAGYYFLAANGNGVKPEDNRHKKAYLQLFVKLLDQKLLLETNADYSTLGADKSRATFEGCIAILGGPVTFGIIAGGQFQQNARATASPSANIITFRNFLPFTAGLFIRGNWIPDRLNYFGRFDVFDPDLNYEKPETAGFPAASYLYNEAFGVAGLEYLPHKNVHLIPNLWVNAYSDKREPQTDRKADVVPRLTFQFDFK